MTHDQERIQIKRRKKKDKQIEKFERNGKYNSKFTRQRILTATVPTVPKSTVKSTQKHI